MYLLCALPLLIQRTFSILTARTAFVDDEQELVIDFEALYEQYVQEFESIDRITAYTSVVTLAAGMLSIPCYVFGLSSMPLIQFLLVPFNAVVWLRRSGVIRIPLLIRLSHIPGYFQQWEVCGAKMRVDA